MAYTRPDPPDEEDDHEAEGWDESDGVDEDEYDPDDPETYPAGLYVDDGPATVPCPHCRTEMLEDSEQCPGCGAYVSKEDAPAQSRGGPWLMLAILALLAVVTWICGRG